MAAQPDARGNRVIERDPTAGIVGRRARRPRSLPPPVIGIRVGLTRVAALPD